MITALEAWDRTTIVKNYHMNKQLEATLSTIENEIKASIDNGKFSVKLLNFPIDDIVHEHLNELGYMVTMSYNVYNECDSYISWG